MGSALGQAHWPPPQAGATSGRWPTVPGVTHLIACAQMGPIRTPGGPQTPEVGYLTSVFRGLLSPRLPPVRCGVCPCLLAFVPRGIPLSRAPCRVPWPPPCPVCPCCLPLLWRVGVLCCLFFFSLPPPPFPLAVSSLSLPFSWVGGGVGGGGGGVLAIRPIAQARRKHGAGTRRGTCPSAGGGGGSPCGSLRHPTLPAVASLVVPPLGPARRVLPVGTVVWFVPHSRSSASPPCRGALGGGGVRFPLPSSPMSPRLPLAALAPFLGGCGCWGWGGGGAPSLPFLRRKHVAGTALARGTALVLLLGSGARRVAPVFALPTLRSLPRCPPRRGLHACFPWARSCGPSRTLSPPSPLLAALSSGGGAAVRPSLPASPTLGGA